MSGQAHGQPDGSWAAAAGAQFGPFAVAVVSARKILPIVTVHFFGREIMRKMLGSSQSEPQVAPEETRQEVTPQATQEAAHSADEREYGLWRRSTQRGAGRDGAAQVVSERPRTRR